MKRLINMRGRRALHANDTRHYVRHAKRSVHDTRETMCTTARESARLRVRHAQNEREWRATTWRRTTQHKRIIKLRRAYTKQILIKTFE